MKIGHSDGILKEFLRHEDISKWHCSGGDPWIIDCLTKLLKSMFTGTCAKYCKFSRGFIFAKLRLCEVS